MLEQLGEVLGVLWGFMISRKAQENRVRFLEVTDILYTPTIHSNLLD